MKPTIIIPIDIVKDTNLFDYPFIVRVDSFPKLDMALAIAVETEFCVGILCDFSDVDLCDMVKYNKESKVNVIINCSFDGNLSRLISTIPGIGDRCIDPHYTYLIPANTQHVVTALKILSSCGYSCGISFPEGKINESDFIELATYSFLSPVQHAPIEPFGYIQAETSKKSRTIDINEYYLHSPGKYLYTNENKDIALSRQDLKNQTYICNSIDEIKILDIDEICFKHKSDSYYSHFCNEDKCQKCSSMKICSGFFDCFFDNCEDVMASVYELMS